LNVPCFTKKGVEKTHSLENGVLLLSRTICLQHKNPNPRAEKGSRPHESHSLILPKITENEQLPILETTDKV